ncbi:MAG: hypothetical protein LUQ26_01825 [Methylococcaceae bacterium]|nr:hypothetical protein [Methylococcaceae bacterium]
MSDLRTKAASTAYRLNLNAFEALTDIRQHCRNEYSETQHMDVDIEQRFEDAFDKLREGLDWLRALSEVK